MRALLASTRRDIELVLTDNSDDPSIMDAFIEGLADDPRIRYLRSQEKPLSMVDNWERTMAAATGRWVAFIGDDDYLDPDLADLIVAIEARVPDIDAIAWNRLTFHWPGAREQEMHTAIPTGCRIVEVARDDLMRKTFGWEGAGRVPTFMFSAYHATVRRDLVEKNRTRFGNRYFEHPVVDQDSAFKIIATARRFIFSERPFSVLGTCPTSNSASIGRVDDNARRHAEFMADLGRNMDNDPHMADFPFPSAYGVTASVGVSQHWFRTTYGLKYDGWEENFARSCALDCQSAATREDFEIIRARYEAGFRAWQHGRFLPFFQPVYIEPRETAGPTFTGVTPLLVHVGEHFAGASTPRALYDAAAGMMTLPEEIPIAL
ncbi:glycosyltransferase family 2 protein [Rhizobium sp. C4]|nr:glycosyltransferase family 2 protein [Rhizobium sp. C4]